MEHRICLLKTVTHLYTCHAHTCPCAPTKLLALPTQSYYSQSYIKSLRNQVTLVILLVLFVCCCTIQTNTHIELFSNMCDGSITSHTIVHACECDCEATCAYSYALASQTFILVLIFSVQLQRKFRYTPRLFIWCLCALARLCVWLL